MIKQFESGKYYRWIRSLDRPHYFSDSGDMDFILDGMPHLCNEGRGNDASFFDSPTPNIVWSWKRLDLEEVAIEGISELSDIKTHALKTTIIYLKKIHSPVDIIREVLRQEREK